MRLARSFAGTAAVVTFFLIGAGAANAQSARSGGAPNAQLLQQMQQVASERTALQAENERMKKELDDVRKERDQLKKGQQAIELRVKSGESALARSALDRQNTEQELTQTKAKMQELIAKFRETLQTLSQIEADDNTAKQSLTRRDQDLKVCTDRNTALYKLNDEVLTHFDRQGVFARVAQSEPFTQIKRVQLENLLDDYRARAQEQKASPAARLPDSPVAGPSPAPSAAAATQPAAPSQPGPGATQPSH